MSRPLLALVLMVKDEASNIAHTIASCDGVVDKIVVLDTGSTDGTQDVVRASVGNKDRLSLYEEPFVDFATTRNRALALHEASDPAVFTLFLSGDEVLEGGADLRSFLESRVDAEDGAYCVELRSGTVRWMYPRVLRTGSGWRYFGENQEVPVGPNDEATGPFVPSVRIVHSMSDPERREKRILDSDLPTLTRMANDGNRSLHSRAQAIFHLAEVHASIAAELPAEPGSARLSHQFEAMALFWRYGQLAEDSSKPAYDKTKACYAYMLFFNLAEKTGFWEHGELATRLEALADTAPEIPEIHYMLATHTAFVDTRRAAFLAERAAKISHAALSSPPLHVPTDARIEWLSLRVAAACAVANKNEKRAREMAKRGIEAGGPESEFSEWT